MLTLMADFKSVHPAVTLPDTESRTDCLVSEGGLASLCPGNSLSSFVCCFKKTCYIQISAVLVSVRWLGLSFMNSRCSWMVLQQRDANILEFVFLSCGGHRTLFPKRDEHIFTEMYCWLDCLASWFPNACTTHIHKCRSIFTWGFDYSLFSIPYVKLTCFLIKMAKPVNNIAITQNWLHRTPFSCVHVTVKLRLGV